PRAHRGNAMNQVPVELRRFAARRLVRGTFLLAVLLVVVAVSINTARGHEARPGKESPATVFGPGQPQPVPRFSFGESDTRIDVGANLSGTLVGTGVALLLLGFVLGASFVGAEFNGGSLSTQLLFEPRRSRVHVAKAVGVGIGVGCCALAILALVAL